MILSWGSLFRIILVSHFEVNLNKALKKATYELADIKQIVGSIEHLSQEQKTSLSKVLVKHEGLLQGKQGQWTGDNILMKLKQDASSFDEKAYPVPLKQL